MDYQIITYGAGEIMETCFNAITSLVSGQTGSIFNTLVRLGSFLGLLWGMMLVAYGEQMHFLTRWFVPYFVILMIFFTPTCTVHILDPTSHQPPRTVEHVPLGLGMVAGTISKMGHSITKNIESTFALPDDLQYHKTGSMMASRLISESKVFHITNPDAADTMREFVNQCVFFDALLGRKYTLNDLKHSDNIWALVTQNASPARAFTYKEPGKSPEILTCREGVQKINALLTHEVDNAFQYYGNRIFGNVDADGKVASPLPGELLKQYLPVSISYMTNMAKSAQDLMRQQMLIYGVIDAQESRSVALGNAPDFAKRRAYLQQRETQESIAWMAGQKLIAMKNVLEVLIYASFIFLLPIALLPMGWRFISTWVSLVLWIQLWPPLYAILNFIMNMAAKSQGLGIIRSSEGISIANSVGFTNLHADMAAQAGYLTISVGALAYALIKGGAASFVHLASHLASPATSAASQATGEMISGNYSFGNVTEGTVQASNMTMGQHMLSPSYSSGSFSQNDGMIARITSADGSHLVNISNSNLRSSINMSESLSQSYAETATQAATASQSETVAFAQSQASAYRQVLDFAHHQAKSQSSGEGHVMSMSASDSRAFEQAENLTDKFAKDNSISFTKSAQLLAQASVSSNVTGGLNILGNGGGFKLEGSLTGTGDIKSTDQDAFSKAQDFVKSTNFRDTLSQATQATQEGRVSTSDEAGQRYMQGISSSLEEAKTHRQEAQAQLQKSESYSEMATFTKQNSGSINANLNQEYMQWLAQQNLPNSSGPMGQSAAEHIVASKTDNNLWYQKQFLEQKLNSEPNFLNEASVKSFADVDTSYQNSTGNIAVLGRQNAPDPVMSQAQNSGFGDSFVLSTGPKEQAMDQISGTQGRLDAHQSYIQETGDARQNMTESASWAWKNPSSEGIASAGVSDLFNNPNQLKDQLMNRLSNIEDKVDLESQRNAYKPKLENKID